MVDGKWDEGPLFATQHQVEVVAEKLEVLAARLRAQAKAFRAPVRQTAVDVAAEIVNEYTQGVGSVGTFLQGVVHTANHLDHVRREHLASSDTL